MRRHFAWTGNRWVVNSSGKSKNTSSYYFLVPLTSEAEDAGQTTYSCTCPGYTYRNQCTHVETCPSRI